MADAVVPPGDPVTEATEEAKVAADSPAPDRDREADNPSCCRSGCSSISGYRYGC